MQGSEWIPKFLARYRAIFHPDDWPDATQAPNESRAYMDAWKAALEANHVTEAEADAAARALCLTPPRRRQEHIPAVVNRALAIRRDAEARRAFDPPPCSAAEQDARARSLDCPECKGNGLAPRKARWHSLRRTILLDLYCRCPAGRHRKAHEPGRRRDDLQARPELWNLTLSHPTWSVIPAEPDGDMDPNLAGLWSYVPPAEATA